MLDASIAAIASCARSSASKTSARVNSGVLVGLIGVGFIERGECSRRIIGNQALRLATTDAAGEGNARARNRVSPAPQHAGKFVRHFAADEQLALGMPRMP
jgi:hypothetical protein